MQEFGAGFGSIYYTPGESNTGIPNFSENSMYSLPVSYGADGYNRVSWVDWSTNGKDGFTHMIPEIQTYSAMAYGEYTLSGEANLTPYFEVMYSQRDSFHNSGAYQLSPYVPANNPFSPCNPAAVGGVDCGDAWDAVLRSPEYAARFSDAYGVTPQEYYDNGWGNFFNNPEGDAPLGALLMRPIVHVMGDRTLSDVTANQQRIVLGLRGDMPFMNFGTIDDWAFDFYAMQSDSDGDSSRPGIRGDRLDHALGWNSANGDMPCVDDFDQGLSADVTSGCVPVNMWASSLYDTVPKVGKKPFPLVVFPHGGPHVREVILYDEWAQLLANRGYMVLQPQYRMSLNYGMDHFLDAFIDGSQAGRKMQDDKVDGALFLVEKGFADPDRMAMFGWSYGGYAALVAASRTPQIYQCVIAGAAVSNMHRQANDFLNRDDGIGEIWREVYLYGAVQPTEEVSKVNVPVLLIHGSVDHRVLLRQAKMYLKELKKYNKPHKYVELEGAGHFSNTLFYHHQLELYTEITEFLANDCGPNGISRDLSAAISN